MVADNKYATMFSTKLCAKFVAIKNFCSVWYVMQHLPASLSNDGRVGGDMGIKWADLGEGVTVLSLSTGRVLLRSGPISASFSSFSPSSSLVFMVE